MGTEDKPGNDQPGAIDGLARDTCQAVETRVNEGSAPEALYDEAPASESVLGSFFLYAGVFAMVIGLGSCVAGSRGRGVVGGSLLVGFGIVFVGVGQMLRLLQRIWRHVWIQTQALESRKDSFLDQGKEDAT